MKKNAQSFLLFALISLTLVFAIGCSENNSGSYVDAGKLETQTIIIDGDTMANSIIIDGDTMINSALKAECPPNCASKIIIDGDTMMVSTAQIFGSQKRIKEPKGGLGRKPIKFYRIPIANGKDTAFLMLPQNQFDAVMRKSK